MTFGDILDLACEVSSGTSGFVKDGIQKKAIHMLSSAICLCYAQCSFSVRLPHSLIDFSQFRPFSIVGSCLSTVQLALIYTGIKCREIQRVHFWNEASEAHCLDYPNPNPKSLGLGFCDTTISTSSYLFLLFSVFFTVCVLCVNPETELTSWPAFCLTWNVQPFRREEW